ncbi:flagellar hook-length control protein FliK [Pseudomonas entomophila]|uniref:flagellar hook-length control protein FliK n=1 Tax=Pseudomonas entomophila TaxID=312306 RepID=UPI0015E410CD|nr:flagellar hook-length control protein FliK [Pseudomonas entomophila]MBA1192544.1 flagellar hook-length control protein FliK [Pseudomonas entomophila]
MPVASNPLLQAGPATASVGARAASSEKPSQAANDRASGFDQVMARQTRPGATLRADTPERARDDDRTPEAGGRQTDASAVTAGGKALPVDAQEKAQADAVESTDARLVAGQVTDAPPGAQMIQAQAEAVAGLPLVPGQAASSEEDAPDGEAFDPSGDALADLPALRLALQHSAERQGTTSAHAREETDTAPDAGRGAVNTLATLDPTAEGEAGTSGSGDKAFGALIDSGLKDIKGAGQDTRVDDFANRLAALTQAVPHKSEATLPSNPLQQPLALNQSAWSEGLVNRVMYLSSQNLKSADIQLEPAELGRLDIRVNMATDQATQITFVSGHAGVRDTLDSQLHRLRELFTQQGLAQPDVSVADQSRGQQQQQAHQQGETRLSGVAARRAEAEGQGGERETVGAVAERQVVMGSSAVDYYA